MKNGFLIFAVSLIMTGTTWALGKEGGGGKAVVCRDHRHRVKSVELLDLWEARRIHGKKLLASSGRLKRDLDLAIDRTQNMVTTEDYKRLDGSTFNQAARTMEELRFISYGVAGLSNFSSMERVRGVDLPPTNDSFEGRLNLDPGCQIEQVVIYFRAQKPGPHRWRINMDLVDKMDLINQSALALHEGIYSFLSLYGWETNTLRIRRVVGRVMAGERFFSMPEILKRPYIQCATDTIAQEIGFSSGPEDPRNEYLNRVLTGFVYFVQDRNSHAPKISMVVDNVRGSRFIDFNNPHLQSSDIGFHSSVPDFYSRIMSSPSPIRISAKGNPADIEFMTEVYFEMRSGLGTVAKDKVTGGGFYPAPVGNLKCRLVE